MSTEPEPSDNPLANFVKRLDGESIADQIARCEARQIPYLRTADGLVAGPGIPKSQVNREDYLKWAVYNHFISSGQKVDFAEAEIRLAAAKDRVARGDFPPPPPPKAEPVEAPAEAPAPSTPFVAPEPILATSRHAQALALAMRDEQAYVEAKTAGLPPPPPCTSKFANDAQLTNLARSGPLRAMIRAAMTAAGEKGLTWMEAASACNLPQSRSTMMTVTAVMRHMDYHNIMYWPKIGLDKALGKRVWLATPTSANTVALLRAGLSARSPPSYANTPTSTILHSEVEVPTRRLFDALVAAVDACDALDDLQRVPTIMLERVRRDVGKFRVALMRQYPNLFDD